MLNYISVIKDGIATVHKNWQLIFIQLVAMIISCISFFVIVGIPIAFAFIMLGLDLTDIMKLQDVSSAIRESFGLLNKYFGIAVFVILSLFLYIMLVISLLFFTLSGTIGIIAESIKDKSFRFTSRAFFSEGKRWFLSLSGFFMIMGVIFVFLAFILGIFGGGASLIIEKAKTQELTLALFLGVFFSLVLISLGLFLIIINISLGVYGLAYMAFNRARPVDALKGGIRYLYSNPSSIGFYALALITYMFLIFLVALIGYPFSLIPLIGPFFSIPYQLATYIVQAYLGLIMLSSVFHYYYRTSYSLSLQGSIEGSDTSQNIEAGQGTAPEETVEN